jgi:hypothetical protein
LAEIIVAGNPVNEFEKTVARTLAHLSDRYVLLTNVILPAFYHKQSNLELDIILLGEHAVYAIETKYWQGSVRGHVNQKTWVVLRDNLPPHQIENPLQRCEMKAKTLNTLLSRWNSGLMGKLRTRALIVVPPHTPLEVDNPTDIEIVTLERLLPAIEADAQRMNREATPLQVRQMAEILVGKHMGQDDMLPFESYRVERVLKTTPRAVSYEATNVLTERRVFIKKAIADVNLPPDKLAMWRHRALREVRATVRLSHPNLVGVLDVLEDEGNLYVLNEWVDGPSLASLDLPLPVARACAIVRDAASGIAAAHAASPPVVHRNLHPGCLLVTATGTRVTNFSVARIEGDPTIVFQESLGGHDPAYVAPELFAESSKADPRSDVYSLGAILYQALSGVKPRSFLAADAPEPLPDHVPPALAAIVQRAMHPVIDQRIASASELAASLDSFMA